MNKIKKTRSQKGITLVALIITIIVLLILAVVAISAIQNDGILGYAKLSRSEYENARANEQVTLGEYFNKIEDNIGGDEPADEPTITWVDNGNGTYTSSTGTTVGIGDKVEYNEGTGYTSQVDSAFVMKDMKWRVLGITNEGQLKLISTQPTDSTLTLSGEQDYLNAEQKLNTLCNDLYGKGTNTEGKNVVSLARSINEEDLLALPGNNGYYTGTIYQFRYYPDANLIQSRQSTDMSNWTEWNSTENSSIFKEPGKEAINSENYQDSEGNYIIAEVNSGKNLFFDRTTATSEGLNISDFVLLGLNSENSACVSSVDNGQWVINKRFATGTENLTSSSYRTAFIWSIGFVRTGIYMSGSCNQTGTIISSSVIFKNSNGYEASHIIRPVVVLKPSVDLEDIDNNGELNIK